MSSPVCRWRGMGMLFALVLLIAACGRGTSQYVTRTVDGSQSLSIAQVTGMASQTLQIMGYGIQEQNLDAGYLSAKMPVPNDIYGRNLEMKVNVAPAQSGNKSLSVQAFTCPGCIPEAHLDPARMAGQFYATFDQVAGLSLHAAAPPVPPTYDASMAVPYRGPGASNPALGPPMSDADQRSMQIATANSRRKAQMGVALQDVTPEIASFLGMKEASGALIQAVEPKGPADSAKLKKGDVILDVDKKPVKGTGDVILGISSKSPGDRVTLLVWREGKTFSQPVVLAQRTQNVEPTQQGAVQSAPSVQINKVEIQPASVAAGSSFDVMADFTASDPSAREREIPVQFSLSILQDKKVIYSPNTLEFKSPNGVAMKRFEHLSASKQRGAYTINVTIRYKSFTAEKSLAFRIE